MSIKVAESATKIPYGHRVTSKQSMRRRKSYLCIIRIYMQNVQISARNRVKTGSGPLLSRLDLPQKHLLLLFLLNELL